LSTFDPIVPFLHWFLGVVNYIATRDTTSPIRIYGETRGQGETGKGQRKEVQGARKKGQGSRSQETGTRKGNQGTRDKEKPGDRVKMGRPIKRAFLREKKN
jgi:hypothetical protein